VQLTHHFTLAGILDANAAFGSVARTKALMVIIET